MSFDVELNDRAARQVLDAITRHTSTVSLADAVLRMCREHVRGSQNRLDETIEAVLAARDLGLPKDYQVQLDGLTLHIATTDAPQTAGMQTAEMLAAVERAQNGTG
jgi:hypothetical protein